MLWMMYVKDTCSDLRFGFVSDDVNGTVKHPEL